jgi:hypothetical protein
MTLVPGSHGRRHPAGHRVGAWAVGVAVAAIVFISPASAQGVVTCVFVAPTVTVTISEDENLASLARDPAGNIGAGGGVDCGAATVTNTDTVVVSDTSDFGGTYLAISTGNGGFAPGVAAEPGSTPEIEFRVDFGGGLDGLETLSTDSVANVRSGTLGINLNADEPGGDADVTDLTGTLAPSGVDAVTLSGASDPDRLNASGGAGAGAPATVRHRLFGFGDPDELTGGSSLDEFFGDAGDDQIFARDGAADTVDCGSDTDTVETDVAGVDLLDANCETRLFAPPVIPVDPPVNPKPKKCKKGFVKKKGKCKKKKRKKRKKRG